MQLLKKVWKKGRKFEYNTLENEFGAICCVNTAKICQQF